MTLKFQLIDLLCDPVVRRLQRDAIVRRCVMALQKLILRAKRLGQLAWVVIFCYCKSFARSAGEFVLERTHNVVKLTSNASLKCQTYKVYFLLLYQNFVVEN